MLDQGLMLLPLDGPPESKLSKTLGVNDPRMARLLGISAKRPSHFNAIGASASVGVLRIIDFLSSCMTRLAVAHTIYLSQKVSVASDAARRIEAAVDPLHRQARTYFGLASRVRMGRAEADGSQGLTTALLRMIADQVLGAYAICSGYADVRRLVSEHLNGQSEEVTRNMISRPPFRITLSPLAAANHGICPAQEMGRNIRRFSPPKSSQTADLWQVASETLGN